MVEACCLALHHHASASLQRKRLEAHHQAEALLGQRRGQRVAVCQVQGQVRVQGIESHRLHQPPQVFQYLSQVCSHRSLYPNKVRKHGAQNIVSQHCVRQSIIAMLAVYTSSSQPQCIAAPLMLHTMNGASVVAMQLVMAKACGASLAFAGEFFGPAKGHLLAIYWTC